MWQFLLSNPSLWLDESQTHVAARHSPSNFVHLWATPRNKCLSILAPYHSAPLVFEEARGGAVPIWTRAGFSSAQLSLLEPYGLVTGQK